MQPIGSSYGFLYHGEREGWLIAYSQHASNDDALEQSNFRTMARALGISNIGDPYDGPNGGNVDDTAAVESYGGAFGPGQYLLVRPGSQAEADARRMLDDLSEYPVLDDEDLSDMEYNRHYTSAVDALTYRYDLPTDTVSRIAGAYLAECGNQGHDPRPYAWDDARQRHAYAVAIKAERR